MTSNGPAPHKTARRFHHAQGTSPQACARPRTRPQTRISAHRSEHGQSAPPQRPARRGWRGGRRPARDGRWHGLPRSDARCPCGPSYSPRLSPPHSPLRRTLATHRTAGLWSAAQRATFRTGRCVWTGLHPTHPPAPVHASPEPRAWLCAQGAGHPPYGDPPNQAQTDHGPDVQVSLGTPSTMHVQLRISFLVWMRLVDDPIAAPFRHLARRAEAARTWYRVRLPPGPSTSAAACASW